MPAVGSFMIRPIACLLQAVAFMVMPIEWLLTAAAFMVATIVCLLTRMRDYIDIRSY